MVPQGFAAPNMALNSTINRGNALTKKLALLGNHRHHAGDQSSGGIYGIPNMHQHRPGPGAGVGPDDLIHLLFSTSVAETGQNRKSP